MGNRCFDCGKLGISPNASRCKECYVELEKINSSISSLDVDSQYYRSRNNLKESIWKLLETIQINLNRFENLKEKNFAKNKSVEDLIDSKAWKLISFRLELKKSWDKLFLEDMGSGKNINPEDFLNQLKINK